MKESDKPAFAEIMMACGENYGTALTPAGIGMRFTALRDYSIEDVRRAAMSLIRSRKYTSMPTVADFMEHLGGGSAEDRAEAAAGKALRAVAEVGRYASVAFDDAVLMAVIEQGWGSWPDFCGACTVQEVKFLRREIARMYAAYTRQGIRRTGYLPGMTEAQNRGAGYLDQIQPPCLVGDKGKAGALACMDRLELMESSVSGVKKEKLEKKLPYERGAWEQ